MQYQSDYRHFSDVLANRRPERLPLYEHIIAPTVMEQILGVSFAALVEGSTADRAEFFRQYSRFFVEMTYDTVSYEVCISDILPGPMALKGGQGPIQSRADFDAYPWRDLPDLYWRRAEPRFDALVAALPPGLKAVGGPGNGVFELAEALVGLECLPYLQVDDPDLYGDLFRAIGDTMHAIWSRFLPRYGAAFVAGRFGDDLGFKSSLLTNPATVRDQLLPQYRSLIELIHSAGLPFVYHSCGCIFEIMDEIIALGINAKHSNEDTIAPFSRWIQTYGQRIALLGGFDLGFLCTNTEQDVYSRVLEQGREFRATARGYALGSGNSIADYVPPQNYLAMVHATQALRAEE